MPWSICDFLDLSKNMFQTAIKFDDFNQKGEFILSETKEFIQGCLKISESERFGWEEINSHALFKE